MLSRWQSTIVDERGNVQPLANLTVRLESDQSLAKMWASPNTSQPLPDGMVQADGNGYAYFYAEGGLYRITSVALGIDWRGVEVGALVAANAAQLTADMAMSTGGMTIFSTFADMTPPGAGPKFSRVINDPDPSLNGYYAWSGSAWVLTTSQPADDSRVIFNDIPQSGSLLHSIPQAGVVELPFALDALRTATRNVLYGDGPYPTLDLRFAGATMLDPRIDFTRASTATGTGPTGRIYTAAIDEPRFVYDPVTGKSEGLLVEGQATNTLLRSDRARPFLIQNVTHIDYETTAPDGEQKTLTKVTIDADVISTTYHTRFGSPNGGDPTVSHSGSVWIKSLQGVVTGRCDCNDGEFVSFTADENWKRISASTPPLGDRAFRFFDIRFDDGQEDKEVVLFGVQLEEGPIPTSYIPTEGSQATRIADTPIIPVGDWFNPDEGTFVVEFVAPEAEYFNTIIGMGSSNGEEFRVGYWGAVVTNFCITARAGGELENTTAVLLSPGQKYRAAATYADSGAVAAYALWVDGSLVGTTVTEQLPNGFAENGVAIGRRRPNSNTLYWNGTVERLTYYPRALSDAELQALTS